MFFSQSVPMSGVALAQVHEGIVRPWSHKRFILLVRLCTVLLWLAVP